MGVKGSQIHTAMDGRVHPNTLSLGCGGASKYARDEWGKGSLWFKELLVKLKTRMSENLIYST